MSTKSAAVYCSNALASLFNWDATPQGFGYWAQVYIDLRTRPELGSHADTYTTKASLTDLVAGIHGFLWHDTPQGHTYWGDVVTALRDVPPWAISAPVFNDLEGHPTGSVAAAIAVFQAATARRNRRLLAPTLAKLAAVIKTLPDYKKPFWDLVLAEAASGYDRQLSPALKCLLVQTPLQLEGIGHYLLTRAGHSDTAASAYHQDLITHMTDSPTDAIAPPLWHYLAPCISGKAVYAKPATQKIRGINALGASNSIVRQLATTAAAAHMCHWQWASAKDVLAATAPMKAVNAVLRRAMKDLELFVRPCPMQPRHGFVDSRIVVSGDDLRSIAAEAVAADPEAELLLTQFIPADYSAVLTETTLSLGKGHDGATSGASQTIFAPKSSIPEECRHLKAKAGIPDTDEFYVELVQADICLIPVQIRGGPAQMAISDYIPADLVVKKVIKASPGMDLLAWERTINNARPGDIVWAPDMSLSNHYCVHAVVHKVPCVTTFEPAVGQSLARLEAPVWDVPEWHKLAEYMKDFNGRELRSVNSDDWAKLGLAALHCSAAQCTATDAQLRLLAYGAAAHFRLMAAACLGELRHVHRTDYVDGEPHAYAPLYEALFPRGRGADRSYYTDRCFSSPPKILERALYVTQAGFTHLNWESAYGGKKWAQITRETAKFGRALRKFQRVPCAPTWAKVVRCWNYMIHQEHNGGDGALAKFGVRGRLFEKANEWPLGVLQRVHPSVLASIFEGPLTTCLPVLGKFEHPCSVTEAIGRLGESQDPVRLSLKPAPSYVIGEYLDVWQEDTYVWLGRVPMSNVGLAEAPSGWYTALAGVSARALGHLQEPKQCRGSDLRWVRSYLALGAMVCENREGVMKALRSRGVVVKVDTIEIPELALWVPVPHSHLFAKPGRGANG